ncbi:hypothetical protein [Nonomuraea fuscirosea]|uniref:hypothetical protein n=1 Tax=Nonomuraea fuscirosea TaxID=1291556 RepID=UPI00340D621A
MIERSAGRGHVCDALTADRSWPRALLAAAAQRFHEALERLLHDAKRARRRRVAAGVGDGEGGGV